MLFCHLNPKSSFACLLWNIFAVVFFFFFIFSAIFAHGATHLVGLSAPSVCTFVRRPRRPRASPSLLVGDTCPVCRHVGQVESLRLLESILRGGSLTHHCLCYHFYFIVNVFCSLYSVQATRKMNLHKLFFCVFCPRELERHDR